MKRWEVEVRFFCLPCKLHVRDISLIHDGWFHVVLVIIILSYSPHDMHVHVVFFVIVSLLLNLLLSCITITRISMSSPLQLLVGPAGFGRLLPWSRLRGRGLLLG